MTAQATGGGNAYGVYAGGIATVDNAATSAITATASGGEAYAVFAYSTSVTNHGTLSATGVDAYAGLRYTSVVRGAYRESLVPGVVDYPISYKAYSQRLLTATAGLRLKGQLSEQIGYQLGLGGEFDLRHRASPYAGSSALPGLESFALPFVGASNHFHAVGSAGLVFQIDRTQRLTGDLYLRSQAFSSQMAATIVAGYQVAF